MNDIIKLRASWRGAYSEAKRRYSTEAVPILRALQPVGRAAVTIHVVEPDTRRDPDGVCAGAAKLILDCLQEAGVLENDGWAQVASLHFLWSVNADDPGCWVSLTPA